MFEIGESLRQARTRQRLELSDVEAETRIRIGYLAALEREQFERLPGPAYARAFLHGYAAFLGLDTRPFLREFDRRFAQPEPPPAPTLRLRVSLPARASLVLATVVLVVLSIVLAFAFSGGGRRPASSPSRVARQHRAPPRPAHHSPPVRPTLSGLVLTASRGDCWLSVRAGSASGRLLYEGILVQGHSLRFLRRWLWMRIGDPSALTARLNGAVVANLPAQTGNVLVTPHGVQPQVGGRLS
jgi:hypothetical protein